MKKNKLICLVCLLLSLSILLTGCAGFDSQVQDIEGDIKGATYTACFYSNNGEKFMTVHGEKINMKSNVVKEPTYNSKDGWGYNKTISSVVTITIDGEQIINCGSTVIFAEDNLTPDVDFEQPNSINSTANGIGDNTIIANIVNEYKNYFGLPKVVIIQSQLGDPICAYSGNEVYWEVCEDLPKTTKVMIDGKALYIHRGNFQLINTSLLN